MSPTLTHLFLFHTAWHSGVAHVVDASQSDFTESTLRELTDYPKFSLLND
jgi:hypothetical protein